MRPALLIITLAAILFITCSLHPAEASPPTAKELALQYERGVRRNAGAGVDEEEEEFIESASSSSS